MPERVNQGVDPSTSEALARTQAPLRPWWGAYGRVLEVTFPAATTRRDVAHGLGVVPDGVLVLAAITGNVRAVDLHRWTADTAYLEADVANARARVLFVTAREGVVDDRRA